MSNIQDRQRTLEVKIRPYSSQNNQERPDQKGVSRVHLCRDALLDLKLDSGQPCFLWKTTETEEQRREAIAWLTSEKSLSRKVIQISKTFQDQCGFKLGDDLIIKASGAQCVAPAESIFLRDISAQGLDATPELSEEDRHHWEWFLRESLCMLSFFVLLLRDQFQVFINRRSSTSICGELEEGSRLCSPWKSKIF